MWEGEGEELKVTGGWAGVSSALRCSHFLNSALPCKDQLVPLLLDVDFSCSVVHSSSTEIRIVLWEERINSPSF